MLVLRVGEQRVGEECAEGLALGGELETACLLCWPWKGGRGFARGMAAGGRQGLRDSSACTWEVT